MINRLPITVYPICIDLTFEIIFGSVKSYCISTLKLREEEYLQLSGAVNEQYESADDNGFSDFAHFQISLAARLAYYLGKDNLFSNIYTKGSDEKVSYLAGWLGIGDYNSNSSTLSGGLCIS